MLRVVLEDTDPHLIQCNALVSMQHQWINKMLGSISHNDYFRWVAREAREGCKQHLNILSFEEA